MRYAEWGAGSEKRVIAVNVPLLKGEVPAVRAVGFGIRRLRELQFMVPEVVKRMRGSKWLSAPPTGSKWLSALPTGSR